MEKGYSRSTIKLEIRIVIELNRWMKQEGLKINEINGRLIKKFLTYLQKQYYLPHRYKNGLKLIHKHLPNSKSNSSLNVDEMKNIENNFRQYMIQERGLTQGTVNGYLSIIRQFLMERFSKKTIQFDELKHSDISKFILRHAYSLSPGHAKTMVYSIRAFLRFLYLKGSIKSDMAISVPTVANWRLSTLPEVLDEKQIECVLRNCEQNTIQEYRDRAIVLLLARLGIRAGELSKITFDDINWELGELIIRGKGNRQDKLPIPHDVGEALVKYIRYARPKCSSRQLFIRMRAPHRGFISHSAIYPIVRKALANAGISTNRKGPHLFRHSLATRMLHKGVSLPEIGKILRHKSLDTTQIYTKVDLSSLRKLVQRWPGR